MPNYLTLVIHVYPAKVVRRLGIQLSPWYRVFHRPRAGPESAKTHSPLPAQHQTRGPRLQDPNASQSPKWAARRNRRWPLGGTVSIQPSPTTSESSPPSMSATVTFPSPTYPHSNTTSEPPLHRATYQAKYTHCSITCWHTPSFPGKASQETGTLALAGPIQPSPRHVALTLIPRDELLPNTDSLQRS